MVGAGPGHPELLTLRGQKWLSRCDVVLYDGLSNTDMLVHAPQAEHICVGKHGQTRIWKQQEIIQEILRHAEQGKCVVRLKGGDPAVFARTSEEVDALVDAKVAFEIVPGITAALAAGSYAGIPITHRGIASAVALVTGHEEPGKPESALDWSALAAFPGTLVIYMGVTTAEAWTTALIEAGKPAGTPCAILRRCSLPDQQQIRCRLDEVVGHLTPASRFRPPVITIVGDVTRLSETMDWFSKRPLHGQCILVTRPAGQADELAAPLEDLGAEIIRQSVIEILPPEDWTEIDAAQDELASFDWLVFASANGVSSFFNRLEYRGMDSRALAGCRIAVVGKATAKRLAEYRLRPDYIPEQFTAESLLTHFTDLAPQNNKPLSSQRFLIVRANRGSDTLPHGLRTAGADVREVIGYRSVDVESVSPQVEMLARDGAIDWVIVTSSASAENLHRLFGDTIKPCRFAAISPITADVLKNLEYQVDAIADPHTMRGIVDAIASVMKP
ncbi:Uroporphyrinogen-III C-methyltransferase [Neorhodopirellula pilleata]|uniref:uroporphyrinogen-III C-methyltransferase n=1 Tax=Neorhodopirellula pilleata TaxID=2714738 RepID=A0A5C5ZZ14_9BACT|nr:Uroporphyrinogen-III C-methyltransferase [Neorhodopirellula pilleata]